MKVAPATIPTSSRLNRTVELPLALKAQAAAITTEAIAYCHAALDRSRFFRLLKAGNIPQPVMHYVFLQYRHWRDRLHQWFGLCIIKAGSCRDPEQASALLSLADHIFTDLQDGHNQMYLEFLYDLGLSDDEIMASQPSNATTLYERSFFDDFGYETDNFYEALAALSGRELCVAIRNTKILQYYFATRHLKFPTWLSLHAELEEHHFQDSILPALTHHQEDSIKQASMISAIKHGID